MRPNVVWYNESLDPDVMKRIFKELELCDMFLIVNTSPVSEIRKVKNQRVYGF